MISIPGSLSFVMSSAPGDARCAYQDPLTHDKSHKILTQIRIRSALFLHRTQLLEEIWLLLLLLLFLSKIY